MQRKAGQRGMLGAELRRGSDQAGGPGAMAESYVEMHQQKYVYIRAEKAKQGNCRRLDDCEAVQLVRLCSNSNTCLSPPLQSNTPAETETQKRKRRQEQRV